MVNQTPGEGCLSRAIIGSRGTCSASCGTANLGCAPPTVTSHLPPATIASRIQLFSLPRYFLTSLLRIFQPVDFPPYLVANGNAGNLRTLWPNHS
jgi:hypothetical protein